MISLANPSPHHRPFRAGRALFKGLPGWFALLGLLLALTPFLQAQDNATINGTVTDSSGAVVPNAQSLSPTPRPARCRQRAPTPSGAYRFANVGIGTYTLDCHASGFEKYTKTGIVVNVAADPGGKHRPRGRQRKRRP